MFKCKTTLLFSITIVLSTLSPAFLPSAAAAEIGGSCKNGENPTIESPGGVYIYLKCTKIGGQWKFVNFQGSLHVIGQNVPAAQAGLPYTASMVILGGTPDYECVLAQGSTLPQGFLLSNRIHPEMHQFLCEITSNSTPILPAGTTKRITSPIQLVITDSAQKRARLRLKVQITITLPKMRLDVQNGECAAKVRCDLILAQASGGIKPYYYKFDSFAHGSPPVGLMLGTDGEFFGSPTIVGTYTFGICAVDSIGSSVCRPVTLRVTQRLTLVAEGTADAPVTCTYQVMCNLNSLHANGGRAPYVFALVGEQQANGIDANRLGRYLPIGLTVNQNGTITGIPALDLHTDQFLVTVSVTDANGVQVQADFRMQILHPRLSAQLNVLSMPQPSSDGSRIPAGNVTVQVSGPVSARLSTPSTLVNCGSWIVELGTYCTRNSEANPEQNTIVFPVGVFIIKTTGYQYKMEDEQVLASLKAIAWGRFIRIDLFEVGSRTAQTEGEVK